MKDRPSSKPPEQDVVLRPNDYVDFVLRNVTPGLRPKRHWPGRVNEPLPIPNIVKKGDTARRVSEQSSESGGVCRFVSVQRRARISVAANRAPQRTPTRDRDG